LILKEILENQGYKVWICTEMTGGRVVISMYRVYADLFVVIVALYCIYCIDLL